jgi:hypothetical protein
MLILNQEEFDGICDSIEVSDVILACFMTDELKMTCADVIYYITLGVSEGFGGGPAVSQRSCR